MTKDTYPSDEVLAVLAHGDVMSLLVWEVHRLLLDQLVHLRIILGASVEGREADDHLVGEDSEGPPIDRE